MRIYDDAGYIDMESIAGCGMPFTFITGARGTGKTYGELRRLIKRGEPFIFMRRTKAETDFLARDESTNPFAALNADNGWNIGIERAGGYLYRIVERENNDDGTYRVIRHVGIMLALSTVANIRGFDGTAYTELFYDEFIPERHARPIRDEHYAFLNAVETIGRNRQLQGKPPLRVVCASNSNRLDNAIYLGLRLIRKVDAMKRKRQLYAIIPDRDICLINLEDSPISQQKRDTALYRMSAGTGFADMALDNKYIGEKDVNPLIRRANLTEYIPLAAIGEICVYSHKSRREYYVAGKVAGTPPRFDMSDTDRERFVRSYGRLYVEYLDGNVYFDDRLSEILFCRVYK